MTCGAERGSVILQLLIYGLTNGAVVALSAVGFTLTYAVARQINLAHGIWHLPSWTGGPRGISGVPTTHLGPWATDSAIHAYILALGLAVAAWLAATRLAASRLGRAWAAVRDDEVAAEAAGVDATAVKLLAFAIGAGYAGLVGAVFAGLLGCLRTAPLGARAPRGGGRCPPDRHPGRERGPDGSVRPPLTPGVPIGLYQVQLPRNARSACTISRLTRKGMAISVSKKRVLVGMSGGVDSSVTAGLLVEQGYDVVGITLNVWPELDGVDENTREDACCALGAVEDARRVADRLGIPYYVVNFRDVFEEKVVRDFVDEYQRGRTPNPCVRCNQFIKFDALLARAGLFGADYVATGHYARIEHDAKSGRWLLRKAADPTKDQSYVLYVMTQERLARALFPLGELTKDRTRQLATEWRLPVANKPESQDICFVPYKRYTEFLERHAPETIRDGPIVDATGQELGRHQGIAFHTIGQRRGLGLAFQEPRYVTALRPETNTVVVGTIEELMRRECRLEDVNWVKIPEPEEPIRTLTRIRYRADLVPGVVQPEPGAQATVIFDEPQRAVTPGQAVVFYDGDYVVGGGTIC